MCLQPTHFSCEDCSNMCTLSYYHQIGSMNIILMILEKTYAKHSYVGIYVSNLLLIFVLYLIFKDIPARKWDTQIYGNYWYSDSTKIAVTESNIDYTATAVGVQISDIIGYYISPDQLAARLILMNSPTITGWCSLIMHSVWYEQLVRTCERLFVNFQTRVIISWGHMK